MAADAGTFRLFQEGVVNQGGGMIDTLGRWLDALAPFMPFSLVGALFGDAFRKDILTRRQRVAAGLAMLFLGPAMGMSVAREFGLSEYTGAVVSVLFAALGTDLIGVLVALIRQFKDDPSGMLSKLRDLVMSLLPWRRP